MTDARAALGSSSNSSESKSLEFEPDLTASPPSAGPLSCACAVASRGRRLAYVNVQRAAPRAGGRGGPTEEGGGGLIRP